jgi:hypothetical protein
MVGRILRPAEDKPDAIVLDHSGAVFRHGFVEDRVEWTLDPDLRAESLKHTLRCEPNSNSRLLECSSCGAIRVAGEACFNCGFLPKRQPTAVRIGDGDLGLVDRDLRVRPVVDHVERARWLGMLTAICRERKYQPGWIAHKYQEKFREWPPRREAMPIEPTPEVRSWVRSRDIAFAKARAAS